ncbi:ABC transporter ATP-binding protein [Planctomicrobium sp. SH664]|uniref:ABC transporter ATP-binding protein n=1 Tax=Planctomicrobium sp. SH664 TaxID=3448125 RepID=UPI003F5B0E6F
MTDAARRPPPRTPRSNYQLLNRLIGIGLQFRYACAAKVVMDLTLVALSLASLGLTGVAIDFLRHEVDPNSPPPTWPFGIAPAPEASPFHVILGIAGTILLFAIVGGLLKYGASIASAAMSERVLVYMRTSVYQKLQRLSFRFYDAGESSSIINRAAGDANAVRNFVDGVMIRVLTTVLTLTVYLVYMLKMHVWLTLICLATTPLLWVFAVLFSRKVQPAYRKAGELGDELIRSLVENVQGAYVVKGFAREPQEIAKFAAQADRIRRQKESIFHRVSVFQPIMGLITQVNMLILLGVGGTLVVQGRLALGAGLFVFANLLQEFASQVGQIVNIANTIQSSLVSAERVFEVIDFPIEIESPPHALPLPRARGEIEFRNVRFGYDSDQPVLEDLSFHVTPGQRIGITGETGSGKTTLLNLVMRFYDVDAGSVNIDGHDVRSLNLEELRRNIGLVFQESFLFSHTIGANIAFGRPDATADDIQRAASIAAAHGFISEMSEGYETLVGEHGANLSGGQRQRLAIARALLLDPPILLLDDATASLDPETEHEIEQAVQQAMQGRTTLVISNRIATLRRADRILVLEGGRITAAGTHVELLRDSEYYRFLAQLQFAETATNPTHRDESAEMQPIRADNHATHT